MNEVISCNNIFFTQRPLTEKSEVIKLLRIKNSSRPAPESHFEFHFIQALSSKAMAAKLAFVILLLVLIAGSCEAKRRTNIKTQNQPLPTSRPSHQNSHHDTFYVPRPVDKGSGCILYRMITSQRTTFK